jgi:Tetracyclin repressor-like, C-terminal domain
MPPIEHPNTHDALIGRARFGTAGVATFERLLSIPLDAGLSPESAFDAYMLLYEYLLGFAAVAKRTPEFREIQQQGVIYLLSLPARRSRRSPRRSSVIRSRSRSTSAWRRSSMGSPRLCFRKLSGARRRPLRE